ncbi:MAG TPA: hypothetical protein GXX35_10725 [Thermoanaerobacterales bacterium]|nr:hypothetical protein [Thermoanaerobacterales bacterium]
MLSGEKKKYSPYLDTGLMEEVTKKASSMGISVNEFISHALISFIESTPTETMIRHGVEKLLQSPKFKTIIIEELNKNIK